MQDENQNIEYKRSWSDEYLKWVCGVLTHSKYQVIKTCRMVRFVNHIITTIFV